MDPSAPRRTRWRAEDGDGAEPPTRGKEKGAAAVDLTMMMEARRGAAGRGLPGSPILRSRISFFFAFFAISFFSFFFHFSTHLRRRNCKFRTPNIALRGFAIPNIDFAKMSLETLSSC
jgi:hypothetical protein